MSAALDTRKRAVRIALVDIQNREASLSSVASFLGRSVRIWSDEWRSWWRPDGCGYTDKLEYAGLYNFGDAFDRTKHCGPEKQIVYELAGGFDA